MRKNSALARTWAVAWSARAAGVLCQAEGRAARASRPQERGAAALRGGQEERGPRFPLRAVAREVSGAGGGALAGALSLAASRAASRVASLARPHAGAFNRPQRRSVWKPWKHAQEDELTEESHLKAPTGHRPVCDGMLARRDLRAACKPCASGRAPRLLT
jgi:hypothetical protein